jgi:tight adherence protein C
MLLAIYILILGSISLITYSLYLQQEPLKLPLHHKEELENKLWQAGDRTKKRFLLTLPLLPLNTLILASSKKIRINLENKLFLAEVNLSPEDFLGIKELLILALFFIAFSITNHISFLAVGAPILIGYLLPDFYISNRVQNRKRLILRVFPDTIDLINLCVDAGLDFMQGLSWVVGRSKPNPLTREFSRITQEVKMGLPRQEALKNMVRRLDLPEIGSFVNALIHAERMGVQINQVLAVISEESRRQKFEKAERLALKAPIKMLFPLILFILPVIGIIVGGPVLLQFLHSNIPVAAKL